MTHRVLLVEDNQANMELAQYLLQASGFVCDAAADGESGVNSAKALRPDVVLCDLQLPDIDGFEVLRRLRAEPSLAGVVVVAVTAFAMVGDRDRILAAGFDGYIAKPLDPTRFASQVAAFSTED